MNELDETIVAEANVEEELEEFDDVEEDLDGDDVE